MKATLPDAADLDGDSNTTEPTDLYYHHNSLGSVVAVTDAAGNVAESYEYSAYGEVQVFDDTGSPVAKTQVEQPWMFTGRRRDFEEESGLYYYRHRYYDAELGRFVSRDPLGTWGDAGNRGNAKNYCGGDPVNRVDPFGLDTVPPSAGGLVGGFVKGASDAAGALGDLMDALKSLGDIDPSKFTASNLKDALWKAIKDHAAALGEKAARRLLDFLVPHKILADLGWILGVAGWEAYWADEDECGKYIFGYELGRGIVEWILEKLGAQVLGKILKGMSNSMAGGGGGGGGGGSGLGPKGGKKHKPGRGHARKSDPNKQKRFRKKARDKARENYDEWHRKNEEWKNLTEEQRKMRPELDPGPEPKRPEGWTPPPN